MPRDSKRILVTLRCETCGADLENEAAVIAPSSSAVYCTHHWRRRENERLEELLEAEEFLEGELLGCRVPPPGWRCTRVPGHDGPCAAVPA